MTLNHEVPSSSLGIPALRNKMKTLKIPKIPKIITPEQAKIMIEEGKQAAREVQEKAKSMHQLTVEDWRTIVK